MNKKIIITALILGVLAIIFGAFGAHALKKFLTPDQLISFETGVRYQMYHALFLLFLGGTHKISERTKNVIFLLILIGVILFSGSIYLLTTKEITTIDISSVAFITPIGGVLLILGWVVLLFGFLKSENH
jgi:uncharacterized membrane protein YgdD (TMEM256/DUF423 family)